MFQYTGRNDTMCASKDNLSGDALDKRIRVMIKILRDVLTHRGLNGLASPNYCWGFAQSIGRSRSIDLFQCISQGFLPTLQKNSRILTFFH
jgi:hypothetical protein